MNGKYETQFNSSVNWYEAPSLLSQDMAKSMEKKEQEIYETSCEDEGNYGPVYCKPPSDEQKIYEEFEGKRFRKLYHKEIWLVKLIVLVKILLASILINET